MQGKVGNNELELSFFVKENYVNLNSLIPRVKSIIILMQGKVGNNELEHSSFTKENEGQTCYSFRPIGKIMIILLQGKIGKIKGIF